MVWLVYHLFAPASSWPQGSWCTDATQPHSFLSHVPQQFIYVISFISLHPSLYCHRRLTDDGEKIREGSVIADCRHDKVYPQSVGDPLIMPSCAPKLHFVPVGRCGHSTSTHMALAVSYNRQVFDREEEMPAMGKEGRTRGSDDHRCTSYWLNGSPTCILIDRLNDES